MNKYAFSYVTYVTKISDLSGKMLFHSCVTAS